VIASAVPGQLRVLLVHERFPPDYGGGGEYVVLQVAKRLLAAGHAVRVLTTGDPCQDSFEGVAVQRLPLSRYRFNLASAQVAAAAADVDVVHCFTYHAAYPAWRGARRLGKPVVLGVLALFGQTWLEMRGPLAGRLMRGAEGALMRLPFDRRIFLSPGSLELAQSLGMRQPGDRVIYPGISLDEYQPAASKDGVAFAGKFESRKGIGLVQQLARELPHIPFSAIGWGDEFDQVARASPPNMRVERFSDRARLAQVLGAARIFLFPTRAETFGLVVAEAMASGCAIVSGAPLEFEGARVDARDPAPVKAALETLWNDPPLCGRQGARNRELAQGYSWTRHMARLQALYHEVVREAGRRATSGLREEAEAAE
jgi:glycosyltransferase involved in cell wall biosynthesis